MGVVYNPLTGNLDYTGSSATPVAAPHYVSSFNAGASWALSGAEYVLTITAGAHGMGVNPSILVLELVGSDYEVAIVSTTLSASGNVTISVPASPDTRFAGKMILT